MMVVFVFLVVVVVGFGVVVVWLAVDWCLGVDFGLVM